MSNTYCGPFVVSHLLDISVRDAARLLRDISGAKAVRGVAAEHLITTLERNGYAITKLASPTKPITLGRLIDAFPNCTDPMLVMTTNHWLVLHGRFLYDNGRPAGIVKEYHPMKRCRVVSTWNLLRIPKGESENV